MTEGQLTHSPTGYGTDPARDRTIRANGEELCRVIRSPGNTWRYRLEFAGISGFHQSDTFESVLHIVRAVYLQYGHLPVEDRTTQKMRRHVQTKGPNRYRKNA